MAEEVVNISKDELGTIEALFKELLDTLAIEGAAELSEHDGMVEIVLETPDSGMVIGYHGEVLEALQLLTSLLVAKKIGRFVRVAVEVGDYRKNREEYLKQLAEKMKERVLDENREQVISQLKPWERRVVHLFLQDDPSVVSESTGEGRERVLVIRPR